ncbi:MAG: ERF family protein [Candidatus Nanopelagicales bacterium]
MKKLTIIQNELKAPKNQFNSFGKYKYRSCEDIQEALKPLLLKHDLSLYLNDELTVIGERYYIKATATIKCNDTSEEVSVNSFAREEENKKGMDGSQVTGASSSYARKYALNGLFLIDDTKDSDGTNQHDTIPIKQPAPTTQVIKQDWITDEQFGKAKDFNTKQLEMVFAKFKFRNKAQQEELQEIYNNLKSK